jgi:hypothetical protein
MFHGWSLSLTQHDLPRATVLRVPEVLRSPNRLNSAVLGGLRLKNKNFCRQKAVFVCLALLVSACNSDDSTDSSGLVARWSAESLFLRDGDPVSTWPDSGPNQHDARATASSAPTYRLVDGVPMVHFDGVDDYLTVGTATDWRFLKDGSDWTLFVVFRSAGGEPGGQHVLLDTDGEDAGFAVSYADRSNVLSNDAVRLSVTAATAAYDVDMASSNRGFPPRRWGIVSASFKASPDGARGQAALFVNGYTKGTTDAWVRPDVSRGAINLNIGRHGSGNAYFTKGDIREIAIYKKALTPQEHYDAIKQLARKVTPAVRISTNLSRKLLSPDPNGYQGFGIAFRSPTSGKLVAIQRQGASHVSGSIGEIRQWESTDRGATWTNRVMYDSEYDDRNVGGGLALKTGSVHAFIARYDGTHFIDMRALRSVDDAQTFEDIGVPLPTNGTLGFSPYGPLVELPSGRLLQTFYGGHGGTNKVWVSESVDDGLTWTYKADISNGPLRVNETSAAWVSGADDATSTLIAISRHDFGSGLLQFVSRDGGNTWTNQGLIPGGNRTDVSPWLYKLSDGTLINAWHEREWFSFAIRMGPAGDVAMSPANWGRVHGTYQATARVFGDSGYPSVLSTTGFDDDLIQVMYDSVPGAKANVMIAPIFLP